MFVQINYNSDKRNCIAFEFGFCFFLRILEHQTSYTKNMFSMPQEHSSASYQISKKGKND